ncbi:MAG: hypothetical protein MJY93_09045 [Fibrobacter sp.]|nr:hypothetical protein [Fibrobacter sp.]
MMKSKKGISILAVLLFMLVATIAGTATYKWLSSEGRSSASRMFQSEARMAALAGIESARSWFAYHGNETGAVVKQVKNAMKNNRVVKLDNQLVAFKKDKQNYSVYVVDVDDSQQPYKIKVVSEGFSRDGTAKFSETAIFKVSGLYQVGLPIRTSPVNFDANYFGGSIALDGRASAEAMIVNGNTSGEEISVTKKLVVTGNVSHGSNKISLAKTNCIGGNLINGNQGIMNFEDLYVGGNATSFSYGTSFMANSIYFNGDVILPTTEMGQEMSVRNVTINGTFQGSTNAKGLDVLGDLCLTSNGKMEFNNPEKGGVKVDGNVWIPETNALSKSGAATYKKVALGGFGGPGKKAYISGVSKCNGYYSTNGGLTLSNNKLNGHYTNCPTDMYYQGSALNGSTYSQYALFTTEAETFSTLPSKQPFNCAEDIKTYCMDNYLGNTERCSDGSLKIDDLLTTAASHFGANTYSTQCVRDVMSKGFAALKGGSGVSELNSCYSSNPLNLYNGYLVVKGSAEKFSYIFTDPGSTPLVGKFIFYIDENENSANKVAGQLPTTGTLPSGGQSIVFMYLPNGAGELLQGGGAGSYRYFVYSLHDIDGIGVHNGSGQWTGSFYLAAKNCAKLKKLKQGTDQTLIFDASMLNDLAESSILCGAEDESSCGDATSTESGSGSTSSGESATNNKDSIRVAVGPNLLVELESQYKTTETIGSTEDVAPSVVVLPRVVYVNSNASGKLSDYYSVVSLNGVGVLGSGRLSCTDSKLEAEVLPELTENTVATCTYSNRSANATYESEFFVKILGPAAAVPNVGFSDESLVSIDPEQLNDGNVATSVDVNISEVMAGEGEYSMDIVVTGGVLDDGSWNIETNTSENFTLISSSSTNERRYRLTGEISSSAVKAHLFTVTVNSSSTIGSLIFTIENAKNCYPIAAVKAITLRSTINITRNSLTAYCNLPGNDDEFCNQVKDQDYQDIPSCEDMIEKNFGNAYEWVTAYGDECSVAKGADNRSLSNNKWTCYTGASTSLIKKNASNIEAFCDINIPTGSFNTITPGSSGGKERVLYADVKHKKYNLHLDLVNRGDAGRVIVYYSTTAYGSTYDVEQAAKDPESGILFHECEKNSCDFNIYAGYHLYMKGENGFSYWKMAFDDNHENYEQVEGNPYHIQVVEDVYAKAVFNARDEHCFYDNFDGTAIFCDASSCPSGSQSCNCIDRCTEDSKIANCSVTDGSTNGKANWTMVYANAPENCIRRRNGDYGLLGGCYESGYYKPLRNDESGFYFKRTHNSAIYQGDAKNDGQESVLLNYANAGGNGTLTASFITEAISMIGELWNENRFINSGFILRSDEKAKKYLTLSIYGKNLTGLDVGGEYQMFARVCYVDANGKNVTNGGKTLLNLSTCSEEKRITFGTIPIAKSMFNKMNVSATLLGTVLNVTVGVEQILGSSSLLTSTITFDLTKSPLQPLYSSSENNPYKYVGLKLSDDGFRIYDIAWRSNSEECWDTPYVSCNFAASYVGGRVPLEQDVMPWVTTSTWLSDKVSKGINNGGCEVKYFYNGCDMDHSRYDRSVSTFLNDVATFITDGSCDPNRNPGASGYYWGTADGDKNGAALKSNAKYNFKYEGLHGEEVTASTIGFNHDGIVRNASVRVTCSGMKRSYLANCGAFWVGPINECTNNETLLPNSNPDYAKGFEFLLGTEGNRSLVLDKTVNLRDAMLQFTYSAGSSQASFYLKDDKGHTSSVGQATPGEDVSVNSLIDEFGFDPQNVTEIVFSSAGGFVITEIKSVCANAPTASCGLAQYDAENRKWKLFGSVTNGDVCEMSVSGGNTTVKGSVVCGQSPMTLSSDEANALVSSEITDYTVSLKVSKVGSESVTCESVANVSAVAVSTPKPVAAAISAKSATCSKNEDGSYHVVVNGCDSYDNCSVKIQRNDEMPETVCNWVSSDCYVTLYNPGTYDILFYDGAQDRRLAGCSGIIFEEGDNNE